MNKSGHKLHAAGHYWYEGIERVCRRLVPTGGIRFLATKVVLDSAIMGSVYVAAFFAFGCYVLEGSGSQGFINKMKVGVSALCVYQVELCIRPEPAIPHCQQLRCVVDVLCCLDTGYDNK